MTRTKLRCWFQENCHIIFLFASKNALFYLLFFALRDLTDQRLTRRPVVRRSSDHLILSLFGELSTKRSMLYSSNRPKMYVGGCLLCSALSYIVLLIFSSATIFRPFEFGGDSTKPDTYLKELSISRSVSPLKYDAPASDKPEHWKAKPKDRSMFKEYTKVSHTLAYGNLRAKSSWLNKDIAKDDFVKYANEVCSKHLKQTEEDVRNLNAMWGGVTLIGDRVSTWDLIEKLALTVDRSDKRVFLVSQYQHVLQIWEAMVLDEVTDEMLYAFAAIHDIGKLVSLFGEDDHNADCTTKVIRPPEKGLKGLHHAVVSWNHDEFGYLKLHKYLPDQMAWMLRYHSLAPLVAGELEDWLTEEEKEWAVTLRQFEMYDHQVKSTYRMPRVDTDVVKEVVWKFLPRYIEF